MILDFPLQLAVTIYKTTQIQNERIWIGKLRSLHPTTPNITLISALDYLEDWGVIEYHTGETELGRCGHLIAITDHNLKKIHDLYIQIEGKKK